MHWHHHLQYARTCCHAQRPCWGYSHCRGHTTGSAGTEWAGRCSGEPHHLNGPELWQGRRWGCVPAGEGEGRQQRGREAHARGAKGEGREDGGPPAYEEHRRWTLGICKACMDHCDSTVTHMLLLFCVLCLAVCMCALLCVCYRC